MATIGVGLRVLAGSAVVALGLFASADAQPTARRATNIAAIAAYPSFYHMRPIVLVGTVAQQSNGEFRVSDGAGSLRVIPQANAPDGMDEVRGQFWDIGRMKPDDPRLAAYDLRAIFHIDPDGAWPHPGEVTAIIASAIAPASPTPGASETAGSAGSAVASIRAIVFDAPHYIDQAVTITGQFGGRNLMGDLPDAPRKSRYDFVLRAADAAIWVTNVRPKVKDGRGKDFDLGLDARIDTGRWLQVSGKVQQGRGLIWIDGQAGSLSLVQAPTAVVADEGDAPVRVPAAPAAEVVFSAPTEDETDVSLTTNIRIQFSRDLDPATLKSHIRVTYLTPQDAQLSQSTTTEPPTFTIDYIAANRVIELKFAKPLERLRTLKVELLEGILGRDQQPLKPWALTFEVAGS